MSDSNTLRVAIIGAGPAGLMAAETLSLAGIQVDIYDAMPSVGRKFLLAGIGGLNITHSEPYDTFCSRYGDRQAQLRPILDRLPPSALRSWASGSGPLHLSVMRQANPEHRLPVAIFPGGELALHAHADLSKLGLGGGFGLEQVQHDALEPGEVVRSVVLAHGRGVLLEIDVQHPVHTVFDAPVRPDGFGKVGGRQGSGRDVVAPLWSGFLTANFSERLHHAQHLAPRPALGIHFPGVGGDPELLPHEAAVGLLGEARILPGLLQRLALGEAEALLERDLKGRLVAFDSQQIVGLLFPDLRSNLALAAHRINGDQIAPDQQAVKQFGDGGDLVALVTDLLLAQHQPTFGGEGTDHVDRPVLAIARASYRLAIDRQRSLAHRGHQAADPAPEGRFEGLGVQDAEHPVEGVVGRNAALEFEKPPEPGLLALGPEGDFLEGVHVAQHRADGHRQDLLKIMPARIAGTARVVDQGEAAHQRHWCRCFHAHRPKDESRRLLEEVHKVLAQVVECERVLASWNVV